MNNPNPDGKPLIQQLQEEIDYTIHKYAEVGLDLGSAIGVLEVCKLNLYDAYKNPEEDEEEEII